MDEATCLRCHSSCESTLHILRDCAKAKAIWKNFSDDNYRNANTNLEIPDWLSLNLFGLRGKNFNGITWPEMFAVIIWQIWKDRNKETIAKEKFCLQVSSKNIMEFAKEIKWAFDQKKSTGMKILNPRGGDTNWCCSITGNMKLNTDASCSEGQRTGIGGVIRNDKGEWVRGYYGRVHRCQVLEGELQAINTGMRII